MFLLLLISKQTHAACHLCCSAPFPALLGFHRFQALDKAFVSDICKVSITDKELDQGVLDQIVAAHLFQQAHFVRHVLWLPRTTPMQSDTCCCHDHFATNFETSGVVQIAVDCCYRAALGSASPLRRRRSWRARRPSASPSKPCTMCCSRCVRQNKCGGTGAVVSTQHTHGLASAARSATVPLDRQPDPVVAVLLADISMLDLHSGLIQPLCWDPGCTGYPQHAPT